MTDFQVAVSVLGAILALFVLAFTTQARRPIDVASAPVPPMRPGSGSGSTPRSEPASADEVAAIRTAQAKADGRLGEVEHHLAQVRTMLNALPSKDAVHRIEMEVAELKGDLKLNNAQTAATGKAVERIENWLMTAEDIKKLVLLEEAKKKAAAE